MSTNKSRNLTIKEAKEVLKRFSCLNLKKVESEAEKERLRDSLILVTILAESENIGVCADNPAQGFAALESYLKAFGYKVSFDQNAFPTVEDPVYIKFNSQKMSHYLDSYTGDYRGVLVSCQSEDDSIAGTYGHFPLDLFMGVE